jgi:hypothetical protein
MLQVMAPGPVLAQQLKHCGGVVYGHVPCSRMAATMVASKCRASGLPLPNMHQIRLFSWGAWPEECVDEHVLSSMLACAPDGCTKAPRNVYIINCRHGAAFHPMPLNPPPCIHPLTGMCHRGAGFFPTQSVVGLLRRPQPEAQASTSSLRSASTTSHAHWVSWWWVAQIPRGPTSTSAPQSARQADGPAPQA